MANWRIAHSTLRNFTLGGADMEEVVQATLVVGLAIDATMGDEACEDDLTAVESAGHKAAGQFLNAEVDCNPYTINAIRGFLPYWVQHSGEHPRWPEDFEALGSTRDAAIP